MTGNTLNKILKLGANHSLYNKEGIWYHNLKKFPGVLFDCEGYVIFDNEQTYINHSHLTIRQDLNIRGGLKNLEGYTKFDIHQKSIIESFFNISSPEEVIRKIREVDLIVRNRVLVNEIKVLYNNRCQICGITLKISSNNYYSEVHHIKPLGKPHNGPDILENMISVCPNCHVLLDLRALKITLSKFHSNFHSIDKDFVHYHNRLVLKG